MRTAMWQGKEYSIPDDRIIWERNIHGKDVRIIKTHIIDASGNLTVPPSKAQFRIEYDSLFSGWQQCGLGEYTDIFCYGICDFLVELEQERSGESLIPEEIKGAVLKQTA